MATHRSGLAGAAAGLKLTFAFFSLPLALVVVGLAVWARDWRVVAAFGASPGAGAVAFEGGMLDRPHLRQAERILAAAAHG